MKIEILIDDAFSNNLDSKLNIVVKTNYKEYFKETLDCGCMAMEQYNDIVNKSLRIAKKQVLAILEEEANKSWRDFNEII